jgi:hypothetical protein
LTRPQGVLQRGVLPRRVGPPAAPPPPPRDSAPLSTLPPALRFQDSGFRSRASDSRFWDSGLRKEKRHPVHVARLQMMRSAATCKGFRSQTSGFTSQVSGFRSQGSGFRSRVSGCRSQMSGFRSQGSDFRSQGSGFRSQGSGVRSQGSGFRSQGSGVRSRVSGLNCSRSVATCCTVQGSGFRVRDVPHTLLNQPAHCQVNPHNTESARSLLNQPAPCQDNSHTGKSGQRAPRTLFGEGNTRSLRGLTQSMLSSGSHSKPGGVHTVL